MNTLFISFSAKINNACASKMRFPPGQNNNSNSAQQGVEAGSVSNPSKRGFPL